MKKLIHLKKEQQQIMPLFDGALIENKPIPFPRSGTTAYSSLFYWAHAEAIETCEFPLHPHEGFEIMTFVLKGAVEHYDTATKVWTPLHDGDVQVIQAGSGVQHAEKITKGTEIFQIWFDPNFSKSMLKDAKYKDYRANKFKSESQNGIEHLSYIGKDGIINSLTPHISIEKLTFNKGQFTKELKPEYTYSCYLLDGKINIDDNLITKDDFFVFNSSSKVNFIVDTQAELFVIKSLTNIEYPLFRDRY